MSDAIELVKQYVEAVTRFDQNEVARLLHDEVRFHELPNRIRPKGGVDDKAAMMAGMRRAASRSVLTGQRYILGDIFACGDRVVAEARWEGDLAIPIGTLKPGETMTAHIAMIFRVRDGLIIEQRNYDCYEDFSAPAG